MGAASAARRRVERRLLESQRGQVEPVDLLCLSVFLQHRPQRVEALAVLAGQRVVHPVLAPVDALERGVLVVRRAVALQKAIDRGQQLWRITPDIPAHGLRRAQLYPAVQAQARHHPGPTPGNGLLDHGEVIDASLDHLQHVLHRQGRIDPFHLDRRTFAQRQLLVQLLDQRAGGTGAGQRHRTPGQLLDMAEAAFALAPHQHQWHLVEHRRAAADPANRAGVKQFARYRQVALATRQGAQQLLLGPGDQLQLDLLAVGGTGIEIMLQGPQAIVFDADRFALDLTGTVAALVDQHPQHLAAADLLQVTDLGRRGGLLRPRQARVGWPRQGQAKRHQ